MKACFDRHVHWRKNAGRTVGAYFPLAHSLAIVGGIIAISILVSVVVAKVRPAPAAASVEVAQTKALLSPTPWYARYIHQLSDKNQRRRMKAAEHLFSEGSGRIAAWLAQIQADEGFRGLLAQEWIERPYGDGLPHPKLTVGIAVTPETFEKIRASNGSPALANAPSDQDVSEFELEFIGDFARIPRLDILTTNAPGGSGAIARFLEKFGEDIQQVEIEVADVDRATEILGERFQIQPIYPVTRAGANGSRVNFFLVAIPNDKKALVELVEQPKQK